MPLGVPINPYYGPKKKILDLSDIPDSTEALDLSDIPDATQRHEISREEVDISEVPENIRAQVSRAAQFSGELEAAVQGTRYKGSKVPYAYTSTGEAFIPPTGKKNKPFTEEARRNIEKYYPGLISQEFEGGPKLATEAERMNIPLEKREPTPRYDYSGMITMLGIDQKDIADSIAYGLLFDLPASQAYDMRHLIKERLQASSFAGLGLDQHGASGTWEELPDYVRSAGGELSTAIQRGGLRTARMALNAVMAVSDDHIEALRTRRDYIDRIIGKTMFQPSRHGGIWDAVNGGVESTVTSVMAGSPGMAVGALFGGLPGLFLGYLVSAPTVFGLSEYQDVLSEAENMGLDTEDWKIKKEAMISGVAEGGIEFIQDLVGAKVFGLIGKGVLNRAATDGLIKVFGKFLGRLGLTASVEIPGEMVTSAVEMGARVRAGIVKVPEGMTTDQLIWDAAKQAIGPTVVQTLLMGSAAAAYNYNWETKIPDDVEVTIGEVQTAEQKKEAEIRTALDEVFGARRPEELTQAEIDAMNFEDVMNMEDRLARSPQGYQILTQRLAAEEAAGQVENAEQIQMMIEETVPEDIRTQQAKLRETGTSLTVSPDENINGVTYSEAITQALQGEDISSHIKEGVDKGTPLSEIQHNLRTLLNQRAIEQKLEIPKEDRTAFDAQIAEVHAKITEALNKARAGEQIDWRKALEEGEIPEITVEGQKAGEFATHGEGESPEAARRVISDKIRKRRMVMIDTRTGKSRVLEGVDAIDIQPGPYEVKAYEYTDRPYGRIEKIAVGEKAKLSAIYGQQTEKLKVTRPSERKPVFRMKQDVTVRDTQGKAVTLPKGEEYRAEHLNDGRVRLRDGKDVTVYEGELSKLTGYEVDLTKDAPMAGGISIDLRNMMEQKAQETGNQNIQEMVDIDKSLKSEPGVIMYNDNVEFHNKVTGYGFSGEGGKMCPRTRGCQLALQYMLDVTEKQQVEQATKALRKLGIDPTDKAINDYRKDHNLKWNPELGRMLEIRVIDQGMMVGCIQCYVWSNQVAQSTSASSIISGYAEYKKFPKGLADAVTEAKMKNGKNKVAMRSQSSVDTEAPMLSGIMMHFYDLTERGGSSGSYTKELTRVNVFGPAGEYVNMSISSRSPMSSMDLKDAQRLRGVHKNASVISVEFNSEDVRKQMLLDWVDHIIPYHLSTAKKIYTADKLRKEATNLGVAENVIVEDFTKVQNDRVITQPGKLVKADKEKNGKSNIADWEHWGDMKKYMDLARERGLIPRFDKFILPKEFEGLIGNALKQATVKGDPKIYWDFLDAHQDQWDPNYMKLVGPEYGKFDSFRDKPGYAPVDFNKIDFGYAKDAIKQWLQANKDVPQYGDYVDIARDVLKESGFENTMLETDDTKYRRDVVGFPTKVIDAEEYTSMLDALNNLLHERHLLTYQGHTKAPTTKLYDKTHKKYLDSQIKALERQMTILTPQTGAGTTLDFMGLQSVYESLASYMNSGKPQQAFDSLVELGKVVYQSGHNTATRFIAKMKEYLGAMWDAYKPLVVRAWQETKAILGSQEGAILNPFAKKPPSPQAQQVIDRIKLYAGEEATDEQINDYMGQIEERGIRLSEADIADIRAAFATPGMSAGEATLSVHPEYIKKFRKPSSSWKTDIAEGIDHYIGVVSTRVKNIDPKLLDRLRYWMFGKMTQTQSDLHGVSAFIEKFQQLDDNAKFDLTRALYNGSVAEAERIMGEWGMADTFPAVKRILDGVKERGEKVGYHMGIEDYFPRVANDARGLLARLQGRPEWDAIRSAIYKINKERETPLTLEQQAEIANAMLRGYSVGKISLAQPFTDPSHQKRRTIQLLSDELIPYYLPADKALMTYLHSMNSAIENAKFFGKSSEQAETDTWWNQFLGIPEESKDDIDKSIGQLIIDTGVEGEQMEELRGILQGIFQPTKTSAWIKRLKQGIYLTTLSNVGSTITQIQDLALSAEKNGYMRTLGAIGEIATGQKKVSLADIGLADTIAQEITEEGSVKILGEALKWTGFRAMDRLGKEAVLNGAFDRLQSAARKNDVDTTATISRIFGTQAPAVLEDLRNGDLTYRVKFLLFNELSDLQPISILEVPEAYLKSDKGKLFYALKTYQIKLMDIYRNEIYNEIKSGNKAKGYKKLFTLTSALVLLGFGTDWIKDFIFGRQTPASDLAIDNFLKLAGISKYTTYQAKKEGITKAFMSTLAPPLGIIDDILVKDTQTAFAMATGEPVKRGFFTPKYIPIGGKLYYWWFGEGKRREEKRRKHGTKKAFKP